MHSENMANFKVIIFYRNKLYFIIFQNMNTRLMHK